MSTPPFKAAAGMLVPVFSGPFRAPITEEQIIAAYELFNKQHSFNARDVVMWKPGMRDRRHPHYGEAAIIMEVREKPFTGEDYPADSPAQDPKSAAFCDRDDILIGCFTEDGMFVQWWVDSRRFQLYDINEARTVRKAMELEAERKNQKVREQGAETLRSILDGLMNEDG